MDAMKAAANAITEAMTNLDQNQHLLFLDCNGTPAGLLGFKCDGAVIELTYRYDMSNSESKFLTHIEAGEWVLKHSGIAGCDIDGEPFALYFKKIYD